MQILNCIKINIQYKNTEFKFLFLCLIYIMEQLVLDNKSKLWIEPNKSDKSISIVVNCRVGSRDESGPLIGISHFLEHLLLKEQKNIQLLKYSQKNWILLVQYLTHIHHMSYTILY